MVCNEVLENLSEYLDGVLPIETKTRVDEHLSVCAGCRKELESLKIVLRELNTLHHVAPPDDFLDQLRGRMTKRPWYQRALRSLFLPLRFKIPIQIAGALTAALLVFSILTLQQNEKRRILSPSDAERQEMNTGEQPAFAPSPGTLAPETKTTAKRPAPAQPPAASTRVGSKAEAEKIRGRQEAAPTERLKTDEAVGIGAMREQQKVMTLVLRIPMNRSPAVPDKTLHKAAEPEDGRFKSKKESGVAPLFHELKALAARHHGRVLSSAYEEGSGRVDSVEIEIPSSEYSGFSEELMRLGDLEPSSTAPKVDQGSVKLSIKVIVSGD